MYWAYFEDSNFYFKENKNNNESSDHVTQPCLYMKTSRQAPHTKFEIDH